MGRWFGQLGLGNDLVDDLVVPNLEIERLDGIILRQIVSHAIEPSIIGLSHGRDLSVDFFLRDLDFAGLGNLFNNEVQLQLGQRLFAGAGLQLVGVLLDLAGRHSLPLQIDHHSENRAIGLTRGEALGQVQLGVVEQITPDLVAHAALDLLVELRLHLLTDPVLEVLLAVETLRFEERFVEVGQVEALDVVDGDREGRLLAAQLGGFVVFRNLAFEHEALTGLASLELVAKVFEGDALDALGTRGQLDVFGLLDLLAGHGHHHVADEKIVGLNLAVGDRRPVAATGADAINLHLHVWVGDLEGGALDVHAVEIGQGELGFDFDFALEGEVAIFGEVDVGQSGGHVYEAFVGFVFA